MLINRHVSPLAITAFCACFFVAGQARAVQPSAAGSVVAQLKSIRAVLVHADHDYQGHRAKAVHELTQAIHALEGTGAKHALTPQQKAALNAARQAKAAARQAGALAKPMSEPQAVSDSQLNTALGMLTKLSGQLGTAKPAVQQHVQNAMGELKTALAIK
jgi:hypothetical protein